MTGSVNPLRGELEVVLAGRTVRLRPTFAALVRAEAEAGSLALLLERAAAGDVRLSDMAALLWACADGCWPAEDRAAFESALVEAGIGGLLPAYRGLLAQAFAGHR